MRWSPGDRTSRHLTDGLPARWSARGEALAVIASLTGDHELIDAQRAVDDPDVADPAVPDLVDGAAVLVAAEHPRQVELDQAVGGGRRVIHRRAALDVHDG